MGKHIVCLVFLWVSALLSCACSFSFGSEISFVTCGSVVKLLNVQHNVRLHSHDVRYGSGEWTRCTGNCTRLHVTARSQTIYVDLRHNPSANRLLNWLLVDLLCFSILIGQIVLIHFPPKVFFIHLILQPLAHEKWISSFWPIRFENLINTLV